MSAFTVAHSITLGLSLYGVVALSPRVVEPLIAVSIAYGAVENIFFSELRSWRIAVVFGFGLLHGAKRTAISPGRVRSWPTRSLPPRSTGRLREESHCRNRPESAPRAT